MKKQAAAAGVLGMLLISGFGQGVVAQQQLRAGGTSSNFGTRSIGPGFTPDPLTVPITSGGTINVRALNLAPGCIGFATAQPDFILRTTGPIPTLSVRFVVPNAVASSPTDTTLVINTASGGWACSDDADGTPNPRVSLAPGARGQYDIWVGSYQSGTNARGTLEITAQPPR